MANIDVMYGKRYLDVTVDDDNLQMVIESKHEIDTEFVSVDKQCRTVIDALRNPISSAPLSELTKEVKNILIISSDNTRPVPSKLTLPLILAEFARPIETYNVTILIATGLHRQMTEAEIIERFGEKLFKSHKIVNHCAKDKDTLDCYGELIVNGESTGNTLWLNKLIKENELVIAEGFIEPHFFAGFSGGRKSIMPGVSGAETIMNNHSAKNINDPRATTANLKDNPIHLQALEACRLAGLNFILNVALNKEKQVIAAFAGHYNDAHIKGCEFVKELMTVTTRAADIVITSNNGYPLDRNVYQLVKGMDVADKVTKHNGIIIIAGECVDGIGHGDFNDAILGASTIEELYEKASCDETVLDQWQILIFAKILMKHKVILVTDKLSTDIVEDLFMERATTLDEALAKAYEILGSDASVNIIPEGPVVIPKL
jgi:nickel-dependent lactate racemase